MHTWPAFAHAALICIALLGSSLVNAQSCDGQELSKQFQTWVQHSGIKLQAPAKNFLDVSELTVLRKVASNTSYMRCKDWPAKPGHRLILATIPLSEKEAANSEETFELNAVVFVMNASNRIAASSPLLKNYLYSGGEMLVDVIFDTARYQIDKNTIAFGVRLSHQVGRWDTFGYTHLDLFFEHQSSLTHALKSFQVYRSNRNKGINCGAVTEEFNRSLSVIDSKTEGLTDLRVVQKSKTTSESVSPLDPSTCVEKVMRQADRNGTLRFNGSHYVIPNDWKE
jgi:hypothetical protein